MNQHPDSVRGGRETFLAIMLALLLGGGFAFFLILITGGFFLWVLLAVVALAVLGYFHYLFWGKFLSRWTAGEREEAQVLDEAEMPEWDRPARRHPYL
jgi:fatty acid desaturase